MSPIERTSVAITYDGPRLVCLFIPLQKEIDCERDRLPSRSTMADVIIVPLQRRTHTDALADRQGRPLSGGAYPLTEAP